MNVWKNRATWLVNLWYAPETKSELEHTKEFIENEVSKLPPWLQDFVITDQINWRELEEYIEDDSDSFDDD